MRGERPQCQGIKRTDEQKEALRIAKTGKSNGKHKPETIEKMKKKWRERKADKETFVKYCKSISESWDDNKRKAAGIRCLNNIKNGNHNQKSSDTSLEKTMKTFLAKFDLEYEPQFILETQKGNWIFDFYVPQLNMLVEVDGEYWHRKNLEQINRDAIKEKVALSNGYQFCRISDKYWYPDIIFESNDNIIENNAILLQNRYEHIANLPSKD